MKLIYLLFVIAVTYSGRLMSQTVNSPDGDIRIEFSLVGQSRHNYPEGYTHVCRFIQRKTFFIIFPIRI